VGLDVRRRPDVSALIPGSWGLAEDRIADRDYWSPGGWPGWGRRLWRRPQAGPVRARRQPGAL